MLASDVTQDLNASRVIFDSFISLSEFQTETGSGLANDVISLNLNSGV